MNNCGISCGNNLKIIAKGDTIIIHYTFSIIHWRVHTRPINGNWQTEKVRCVSAADFSHNGIKKEER